MNISADNEAPENRCRLVLVADVGCIAEVNAPLVDGFVGALSAGDVASIVFHASDLDEATFQKQTEPLVAAAQRLGIACIMHEQSRVAGRIRADGLQLGQDPVALEAAIQRHHPAQMIGAGNVKTRHNALVLGELQPDYLMFGVPGADTRPEPYPKNLALGEWWSSIIEIPCIVLGGTEVDSVVSVAKAGAEFVALGKAVFATQNGSVDFDAAAAAIAKANQLLDDHAPRFE